jgi:hypothetical protein
MVLYLIRPPSKFACSEECFLVIVSIWTFPNIFNSYHCGSLPLQSFIGHQNFIFLQLII